MASLMLKKKGTGKFWEIQFYDEHNRRKMISLSSVKFNKKTAKELKDTVETLLYYKTSGITVPDKKVENWIKTAAPDIQEKLAKVGLLDQAPSRTCKELWDAFMATKKDIKETTRKTYEAAEIRFFLKFGKSEYLSDVTSTRITEWKTFLRESLAEATVTGTISKVRTLFNWAKEHGWVLVSPMVGVPRGSFANPANDQIVSQEEYLKLLECCPCQEWRTILALVRYGGLRCPSEVMKLHWKDIDWNGNRFLVRSPKTEHHKGKGDRLVPLFPEVREELKKLFFLDKGKRNEFVINRYPERERANLGTQFARIVRKAGLPTIKRPYDNMRASRSNEIYADFGPFYESQWIGHSSKIAKDHYLSIRDEDFQRASDWQAKSSSPGTPNEPTPEPGQ